MPCSSTRARSKPRSVRAASPGGPASDSAASAGAASCTTGAATLALAAVVVFAARAKSVGLGCAACSAMRPRHLPAATRASQLLCRSSA